MSGFLKGAAALGFLMIFCGSFEAAGKVDLFFIALLGLGGFLAGVSAGYEIDKPEKRR